MNRTISQKLKDRRQELGLSLSQVARRAGTSSATLSRYEHGWNRFEVYTLKKLAVALGCDLRIEFKPRSKQKSDRKPEYDDTVNQLKRLFWDHPLRDQDLKNHQIWVAERVLEYGNIKDVINLCDIWGKDHFVKIAAQVVRVSRKTRNFWCQMLKLEGKSCTKKYSRNTVWNY